MKFVNVTSQGQISIPTEYRHLLGVGLNSQVVMYPSGNKLIIEPSIDFMSMRGALSKYALKGKSIQRVIELEKEAAAQAVADEYIQNEKLPA